MSKPKVYIDGKEGTTGLQIYERLGGRGDIELLLIDEALRKDTEERRRLINAADIVFLCLPDPAAREAVTLIENPNTRVIDASTAHRTAEGWVYGLPELRRGQRERIAAAKRVANPGCHATGAVSIIAPLTDAGLLPGDYPLTVTSLTGYSGGGKKMIAQYADPERDAAFESPRLYGLTLSHKHLPEIVKYGGLAAAPVFCPIVADYYAGMEGIVALQNSALAKGADKAAILAALRVHYAGERFVRVLDVGEAELPMSGYLESNANVGTNRLDILVYGSESQTVIVSRFDNLGKGASGAAVQNMNIMLGLDEDAGLI